MGLSGSIWRNESPRYAPAVILLVVIYLMIFHMLVPLGKKIPTLEELDKTCLAKCSAPQWQAVSKMSRGEKYYLTDPVGGVVATGDDQAVHQCGITLWEFSHLFMHVFIGWWLDLRWSLIIGGVFEFWEWREHRCENKLDIAYNSLGAIVGGALRHYSTKRWPVYTGSK